MINQLKGALKMFFIINLLIAALNIWILKDNRHVIFAIVDDTHEMMPLERQQADAFNQFRPE